MPAPETLSFSCPHCSTRLTVPASLAGVTGPCPSCRKSITAPTPVPSEVPQPQAPPLPVEAVAPEPVPVAAGPVAEPEPVAVQPELPIQPAPPPEVPASVHAPAPGSGEPVFVEVAPVPVPEGHRIKPEPRKRKEKSSASPISPRHSTADESMRRSERVYSAPRSPGASRILRASGAAAFCAAATTVSYLLLYFFLPTGPARKLKEASRPLSLPPAQAASRPAETPQANPGPPPAAPLQAPQRVTADDSIPPPDSDSGESPAILANQVLDRFLAAKDAASRVELVEPAATEGELAATLLKGPLPEVARILPDLPQRDAVEQFTDYPYRVSFFLQSGRNVDFTIVVRQRGDQAPKVFLPAFLDLAGGRLSAFAKEPNKSDPVTFHVILDPLSVCHDENIPGAERKITFKLLPSMFGKEITRAYVSSGSRFAQMVGDPNSSLRWGVRMRATITVQWNHTEDPQKPYLELMNISSLNWNS